MKVACPWYAHGGVAEFAGGLCVCNVVFASAVRAE